MAVNKWRGYLIGRPFVIKTDHEAIKYLLSQKITTLMQQKWLTKLLGFDYRIVYKRGKENVVADPLSRLHERKEKQNAEALAITVVVPQWKFELRNFWALDPGLQEVLTKQAVDPSSVPDFTLMDGDLRRQGKLVVGITCNLREQIIHNLHGGSEGGHSGITATIKRINNLFWWPNLQKDVTSLVQQCEVCQRCKGEHLP